MTDGYTSDEEQVEQIKQWWQENGTSVIAGAGIGIAAILGWQFYTNKVTTEAEYASAVYDNVVSQANATEAAEEVTALISELKESYAGTPYAVLAAFANAKKAVEDKDLAAAEESLGWIVANSKQPELVYLAKWRLARVQVAAGNYDAALATIETGRIPVGFEINYAELRGDILAAQGKNAEAITAYEEASELAASDFQRKNQIDTKLNSIR